MSLAFFDFDKTVIHGDAGPRFGVWLFMKRRHRIEDRHGKGVAAAKKAAMWSKTLPYVSWMTVQATLYKVRAVRRSTVVRNAYKGLKGVPVQALDTLLEAFVEEHIRPIIYPKVVDAIKQHQAAGRTCVIVTTGMELLVKKCLPFLPEGVQLVGCELEAKDGRLTGRVVRGPLYGADKANIVGAWCRAAGADPADCYAYTDHYSDYHMLEAVGHGVCINPAPRLTSLARRKGWQIWRLPDPSQRGPMKASSQPDQGDSEDARPEIRP